jgi:formylglycine-generating enzyme required for sulfatase activity
VTGGTFERRINTRVAPATVSDFRLDKYEVTVGRFRNFVSAWNAGYRPPKGAGKHTHLNGGSGVQGLLAGPSFGAVPELGWQPGRSDSFPSSPSGWAAVLGCGAQASWRGSPGGNETLPINCVNRYEAAAFCAWDGGFLPTFAEYDYARVGGSEQRVHPWSNPPTSTASDASQACQTPGCIEPVGSHPAGDGKFGQSDLEGNSLEWLLDTGAQPLPTPCTDCASGNFLATYAIDFYGVEGITRADVYGFRCARVP